MVRSDKVFRPQDSRHHHHSRWSPHLAASVSSSPVFLLSIPVAPSAIDGAEAGSLGQMDVIQQLALRLNVQSITDSRVLTVQNDMAPKECEEVDSGRATDDDEENFPSDAASTDDVCLPVFTTHRELEVLSHLHPCPAVIVPTAHFLQLSSSMSEPCGPSVASSSYSPPFLISSFTFVRHTDMSPRAGTTAQTCPATAAASLPPVDRRLSADEFPREMDCGSSEEELENISRLDTSRKRFFQSSTDDGFYVSDSEVSGLLFNKAEDSRLSAKSTATNRLKRGTQSSPCKRLRYFHDNENNDCGVADVPSTSLPQRPSLDLYKMQRTSLKRRHTSSRGNINKPRPIGSRSVVMPTPHRPNQPFPDASSRDPSNFCFRSLSLTEPCRSDSDSSIGPGTS